MADDHVASLPPADGAARGRALQRRRTERATRGRSLTVVVRSGRLRMTAQTIIVPRARRASSFAPLARRTMSGGVDGALAQGSNAFSYADPADVALVYDSSIPGAIGGQCVRYDWALGDIELTNAIVFPNTVGHLGEVWLRVRLYIPIGFNFLANAQHLKFVRVLTKAWDYNSSAVEPTGSLDYLIRSELSPNMLGLRNGSECHRTVTPEQNAVLPADRTATANDDSIAHTFPFDEWFDLEVYAKLDGRRVSDEGGAPVKRTWVNNVLIHETTTQETLYNTHAQTYIDEFKFIDFWNGGSAVTQALYIDEFVFTDNSNLPPNTDASGNNFIGNWQGV